MSLVNEATKSVHYERYSSLQWIQRFEIQFDSDDNDKRCFPFCGKISYFQYENDPI